MKTFLIFCVSFLIFKICAGYQAAVFELYVPSSEKEPTTIIKENLKTYRGFLEQLINSKQSVDIAVFPEYGLTTLTKDPEKFAIEIKEDDDVIKKLTAMANEHDMYLVVNILEKEEDSNKKIKYYNTNLVFNKTGQIITKYRKINLFNEEKLTPGAADQNMTFTTDFGVTFATFTSTDILFENPSRTVLENSAVTDIVYPTAWFSTMPFFTALSIQHGYAVANGVNLLAANYGKAKEGHGGSGIYSADGKILEMYIADSTSSKPIIQKIQTSERHNTTICRSKTPFGLPGDDTKSNVSYYKTEREFKASNYKLQKIDLTKSESTTKICDSTFCCTFTIHVDKEKTDTSNVYKVMAYDGLITYGNVETHVRVCSLVACENDSDDSCGARADVNSTFTKITVEGNLLTDNTHPTYYTPMTLNTYLLPLSQTDYCNNKNGTDSTYVKLSMQSQKNVLVFGILGTVSSAVNLYSLSIVVLIIISVFKNFVL